MAAAIFKLVSLPLPQVLITASVPAAPRLPLAVNVFALATPIQL